VSEPAAAPEQSPNAASPIVTPPPVAPKQIAAPAVVSPPVVRWTGDRELLAWRAWRLGLLVDQRGQDCGPRLLSLSAPCIWDGPAVRMDVAPFCTKENPSGIYTLKPAVAEALEWSNNELCWVTGTVAAAPRRRHPPRGPRPRDATSADGQPRGALPGSGGRRAGRARGGRSEADVRVQAKMPEGAVRVGGAVVAGGVRAMHHGSPFPLRLRRSDSPGPLFRVGTGEGMEMRKPESITLPGFRWRSETGYRDLSRMENIGLQLRRVNRAARVLVVGFEPTRAFAQKRERFLRPRRSTPHALPPAAASCRMKFDLRVSNGCRQDPPNADDHPPSPLSAKGEGVRG